MLIDATARIVADGLTRSLGQQVLVAPNIRLAVQRALYTEVNAQQLVTALSFKRPITFITPDEAQDPKRLDDAWEVWTNEVKG